MDVWEIVHRVTGLGAEISIVIAFLWYLHVKDRHVKSLAEEGHDVVRELARSFHQLKTSIDVQTEVMRRRQND